MDKVKHLDVNGQTLPPTKPILGFTQISNAVLLDQRLSFKARGILALLLSRPKDWKIYLDEIASRSGRDGKRAVQSGFKELSELGYVKLKRVYNQETGRFAGTCYQLDKRLGKNRQPHFRTAALRDCPQSRQTGFRTDPLKDRPETTTLNNTQNRNIENRNNKHQQQTIDNGADKNDISYFARQLSADIGWQQLFLGNSLGKDDFLTKKGILILLHHFARTSIQAGQLYSDLSEVKKHFCNWYRSNLSKGTLLKFIGQHELEVRKARTMIGGLLPKTESILLKIQQRRCGDVPTVLRLQEKLNDHLPIYQRWLPLLTDPNEVEALRSLIADIHKFSERVDRGQMAGQLDWFCSQL